MPGTPNRRLARGVASLTVVMVLFFVLSLVAAYTSRNLIFEQRTSGNQYRSTQAFEAAEAGLEWAMAMLNSGRISDTCAASTTVADLSFRERYLSINAVTGNITPVPRVDAPALSLASSCVFNGTNWQCSCPSNGAPVLILPSGNGVFPAFRVRFVRPNPVQPGVVVIESNGCTRADDTCLRFENDPQSGAGDGRATVSAVIALQSGLVAPPIAALTVRGNLNVAGAALGAYNANADPPPGGITIFAGGNVARTGLALGSTPGSLASESIIESDPKLADLPNAATRTGRTAPDLMFASMFGMWPDTYRTQPGTLVLACAAGTCNAAQVRTAASLNPGRMLWVAGNLDFNSAGDIGTLTNPVTIVATGNVGFTNDINVYGVVYSRAADWTTAGAGRVLGAGVAEGNLIGAGTTTFVHDTTVLEALRLQSGSFVRVPGGWRDFR